MKLFLPYYRHLRAVKWPFLGGVLAGLVYAAASGAGLPLMAKLVFPVIFQEESTPSDPVSARLLDWIQGISPDHLLLFACLWIPVIFAVRAAGGYANTYLIQLSGLRVLEGIRLEIFAKLQSLPLAYFKKNRSGDLLSRLINDAEILRQVIANGSSDLIKQPATLLFAVGFLIYNAIADRSFFVALISMVTVPICVMVIRVAGKKLANRARALQARAGDLTAMLAESLQSALEIRAYNLQQRQTESFRSRIREMLRLSLKVVKYRAAISPSIEVVAAAGFAAALYFGRRAGMSLEDFMALGMALYMSYEPIKKLGNLHSLFRQGEAAIERIDAILHEPNTVPDPSSPRPFQPPRAAIRFDHVSFAYAEEPVLRDIALTIPVGQVVALVGPSGAGKSTFAALVPRFYDPLAGAVTFDGIDLREFATQDLRGAIAVVPQMPALFSGSIAENIRLGRLSASDEEVEHAARRAHAHDFILAQPEGYATQVGERGDSLSGGQRQRIAIARAFLRDAPILILDEATSALDSESEAKVQSALAELVKGRTTFIIAHRFSTIAIADRILVFQQGSIVADGGHAELRESDATYRSMLVSQGA